MFPYFRDNLPEAPFDSLTEWHHVMVLILDEINLAVDRCDNNDQLETEPKNIENADALIPVEEQLRLVRLFAGHGLKNAEPHYLTVPFLLYNLPLEGRMIFSQGMPAEVIQNLVPVVWKEKWESMKPYLLE